MEKLDVGVVGLGLGWHHAAAYTQCEEVGRLVVCDLDPRRVREGYDDLDAMLEAERLDAVSIVTPDHLHRAHAERCLERGCHVLLTKPLATNLEDGRAIVRAAEAASRVLMVAHERRFRTHIRAIREMLEAGELGEIIHLRIDAIQDRRAQFSRSPWYASAEAGRTALVGTGVHEVDLLRYFVRRPIQSVCAYSNQIGTLEFPKDKTTAALFRFEGGTIGQVTVTYEAHWPKAGLIDDHFRLVSTKGLIVGFRVAGDGRDDWEDLPRDPEPLATGTLGCVKAFLRSVVEGAAVAVSGRDAFASLAACVAADESAATGKPAAPAPADFE
jgi:UDP-N-acetylglucosamine 3-dehydrogenase